MLLFTATTQLLSSTSPRYGGFLPGVVAVSRFLIATSPPLVVTAALPSRSLHARRPPGGGGGGGGDGDRRRAASVLHLVSVAATVGAYDLSLAAGGGGCGDSPEAATAAELAAHSAVVVLLRLNRAIGVSVGGGGRPVQRALEFGRAVLSGGCGCKEMHEADGNGSADAAAGIDVAEAADAGSAAALLDDTDGDTAAP